MDAAKAIGIDEDEALEKLETLWSAYEEIAAEAARYDGSLGWKTNAGQDYLVHTVNLRYEGNRQRTRSLGPRSEETERRMAEFREGRERARDRLDRIRSRLDTHGRVLKALQLGRIPALTARFLRELRAEGLGAKHFRVGGMAALAAYEVRARTAMPFEVWTGPDFDMVPTELFVRDRPLFDAIASRKIFGPVKWEADRIVLGRGVVIRLLDEPAADVWSDAIRAAGGRRAEIEALRWAFELPTAVDLLAVGLDGSPAPVPAVDPRAYALLSAVEARFLADETEADRLRRVAVAAADSAGAIVPEPFEPGHLDPFPELAAVVEPGGIHADMPAVMRL